MSNVNAAPAQVERSAEALEVAAPRLRSDDRDLLDDLERGALIMARGGAGEQCANRLNGLTVAANDPADIALAQLQAKDSRSARWNFRDDHLIGKLDQLADDELEKLFHA